MFKKDSTTSKLEGHGGDVSTAKLDDPFEGESTGVRPRAGVPLPEEEWLDETTPSDIALPAWEDLAGLRDLSFEPATPSTRQLALDLVEAERQRRTSRQASKDHARAGLVAGVRRRRGGASATLETPLPWVQRFERDTSDRLAAVGEHDAPEGTTTQGWTRSRPVLAVPPPAPPRPPTGAPPPPPSRQSISRPGLSSSFPPASPLPRFALGPRIDALLGSERRRSSAVPPSSLAPLATDERRERKGTNPWLAGMIGALVTAAVGFAFFWTPQTETRTATSAPPTVSVPLQVPVHYLDEVEISADTDALHAERPFDATLARRLGALAVSDATGCESSGQVSEVLVTFASDGAVQTVQTVGGGAVDEEAERCLRRTFSALRIPPFDGEPQTVRIPLR